MDTLRSQQILKSQLSPPLTAQGSTFWVTVEKKGAGQAGRLEINIEEEV